jgi:hypothetical protein
MTPRLPSGVAVADSGVADADSGAADADSGVAVADFGASIASDVLIVFGVSIASSVLTVFSVSIVFELSRERFLEDSAAVCEKKVAPVQTSRWAVRGCFSASHLKFVFHAYNLVDWYPWGEAAFEKAKKEDKLIFLSIDYSTVSYIKINPKKTALLRGCLLKDSFYLDGIAVFEILDPIDISLDVIVQHAPISRVSKLHSLI